MADILPLQGWRYAPHLTATLEEITSPLFDVVSEKQRRALSQQPYNSIHLSVPQGPEPHLHAQATLANWKQQGIIKQDEAPGIYVYYQHFRIPGNQRDYVRKGFICNIRATDWDQDWEVRRHENTIPHSVNDRLQMLEATQLNVSPTHGLYSDPNHTLEAYMDAAIENPVYDIEDYQGVRNVMAIIDDPEIIQKFVTLLVDKQVIIADGHHRYESSMEYRKRRMAENPNDTGNESYHWHLMYLTNAESDDLRILPTHRLLQDLPSFSMKEIMEKLAEDFHIKPIESEYEVNEIILGKLYAFGLIFDEAAYKIRLKEDRLPTLSWKFPDAIKALDLTVMHYFVIEKVLGIPGHHQRASRNITFDRSFPSCLNKVHAGEAQMAIIMKDVSMQQVKEVCQSGYTMPQKSTYFYPKALCGYVFGSIADEEFTLPAGISL